MAGAAATLAPLSGQNAALKGRLKQSAARWCYQKFKLEELAREGARMGLKGIDLIMNSEILEPINLGSSEAVTINQLVDIVEEIAGIKLKRNHDLTAPKGVNGRNSDNTLIKKYLNWEPNTPLRVGLERTYRWIYDQYMARERGEAGVVKESAAAR